MGNRVQWNMEMCFLKINLAHNSMFFYVKYRYHLFLESGLQDIVRKCAIQEE